MKEKTKVSKEIVIDSCAEDKDLFLEENPWKNVNVEQTLNFTTEDVKTLRQFPFIDQTLVEDFFKKIKEPQDRDVKWKDFLKSNPSKQQKEEWLEKSSKCKSIEESIKELNFLKYITENRKQIIQWLESEAKSNTFKKSGHLVDQQLKYLKSTEDPLHIFSLIENRELKNSIIQNKKIQEQTIQVGINLTAAQDRLVNALCRLLHEKSQIFNPDQSNYYTGNSPYTIADYGKKEEKIPSLVLEPHELYQAYLEKVDFSGKEISNIEDILEKAQNTRHLIIYEWRTKNKTGKTIVDRIEQYQPLFIVDRIFPGMNEEEADLVAQGDTEVRRKKGKFLIKFNPLFIHQIESKYVLYPKDIHQRMAKAAGGDPRKVTPAMNSLRDFCLRALSNKQKKIELNQDTLPLLLKLENYVKSGRKKEIIKKVTDSFQVCRNIGLIDRWEEKAGTNNQTKYVIHLNPGFLGNTYIP
ncbi:MAG: hypothetical protein ACH349_07330 [Candidatus Rhabdochlamydia sp.]|jgi:hypothetical protein|nr:hypothetical protein [Chlamydiota bacterium]